ncbi:DUF885 family protein, partial [Mycolicibacterium fortuitum]|uniref:DUF885 family protein n=1 Tax=Mycolicibacterium fortuitum TaxID=1766 RepID=UPI000B29D9B5
MARAATAVDAVAERYLDTYARLDPCAATELGITGHDDEVTDYSPEGVTARAEAARATLRELDGIEPTDDVDVVTVAALRERLGAAIDVHDAGLDLGELNVIASPLQTMRDVFDLMATDTEEDWALIATRLARVPERAAGYADAHVCEQLRDLPGLRDATGDLAKRRGVAAVDGLAQGVGVTGGTFGHSCQPGGDQRPVFLG